MYAAAVDMGDMTFTATVGLLLSFLPKEHFFRQCLKKNPSVYHTLQVMETVSGLKSKLRTYKYNTCSKGMCVFKDNVNFCEHSCRWRYCSTDCFDEDDEEGDFVCGHVKEPVKTFWYMPIRDRITALLKSDLKNFFFYEKYRHTWTEVH